MKKYWFCVVEVEVPEGVELPDGADRPMRNAIKSAVSRLDVGDMKDLFSGWGLNETGAKTIRLESIMPINNGK